MSSSQANAVKTIQHGAKHGDAMMNGLDRMLGSVAKRATTVRRGTEDCKVWCKEFVSFCETAVGALGDIDRYATNAKGSSGSRGSTATTTGGGGGRAAVTRSSLMKDIAAHVGKNSPLGQIYIEHLTKSALASDVSKQEQQEKEKESAKSGGKSGRGSTRKSTVTATGNMVPTSANNNLGAKRGRESGDIGSGPSGPSAQQQQQFALPSTTKQTSNTSGKKGFIGSPQLRPHSQSEVPAATATIAPPIPLPPGRTPPLPPTSTGLPLGGSSGAGGAGSVGVARSPLLQGAAIGGGQQNTSFAVPPTSSAVTVFEQLMTQPWLIPQPYTHGVTLKRTNVEKHRSQQNIVHPILDMCNPEVPSAVVLKNWKERNGSEILGQQKSDATATLGTAQQQQQQLLQQQQQAAAAAGGASPTATGMAGGNTATTAPAVSPTLAFTAKQQSGASTTTADSTAAPLFLHRSTKQVKERTTDARLLTALVHYGVVWCEQAKFGGGGGGNNPTGGNTNKVSPTLKGDGVSGGTKGGKGGGASPLQKGAQLPPGQSPKA